MLVRSAHSANIKERRDCSTALFDPAGEMVMQAEHIPVHLGAMPAAVAAVVGDATTRPGASWVLNDPYAGGTHLPDITVVTPAFAGGELLGFAASRAHHADVGGRVPGSMPADSRTLDEEGVVIAPRVLDDAAIDELVAQMRQPAQRRADLRAQLAANRDRRAAAWPSWPSGIGADAPARGDRGGARLRRAAHPRLPRRARRRRARTRATCSRAATATSSCALRGDRRRRRADARLHRLSAAQHAGNLNCPLAVTRSACLFAVRVLTDPDIPPSAGAYRPITVIAPEGSLLNARAAGGRRRPATSRRQLARRRPRARRVRPRARPGDDEQPDARQRRVHLLRDARRRPGRVPGRRRPERRPRRDVQHAQHAGRGARARVPAARRRATRCAAARGGAGRQRGGDGVVRELEALAGDDATR